VNAGRSSAMLLRAGTVVIAAPEEPEEVELQEVKVSSLLATRTEGAKPEAVARVCERD
jgi:hypothetical protein